jgi:hypothetical protein
MNASDMIKAVRAATKKWARQRKAEERDSSRQLNRRYAMTHSDRVFQKEVAWEVMKAAYLEASSNNTLPAHARQVMYKARGPILARCTDKDTLDSKYFTQTLLPDYIREHPGETADWDVVFDARGHFLEPHTATTVPLGTLDVRAYLGDLVPSRGDRPEAGAGVDQLFPTRGPAHRFGAILFIEKEGFLPLFRAVHLAERFDLAIMSTKGMSVTAARLLVDRLCAEQSGVPLLVLHDFDKAGFSIVGTLWRDNRRYQFQNKVRVIDLGLRLEDVRAHGLEAEAVVVNPRWAWNLRRNGATEEEVDFLCAGQRVELNAFASRALVDWIESKLDEHGIKKVVPPDDVLAQAYRRAAEAQYIQDKLDSLREEARDYAAGLALPRSLGRRLKGKLKADPATPWDRAIWELTSENREEADGR